ncbi:MAG: protein kinase [Cyanobacteria bacterium P01_F01_bin.86]
MTISTPKEQRGQRTLAAIVLTDAVGFSARMSVDEETTLSLIHNDLKLFETLCKQFEGRVIKSTGDGLLMYFVSAVQAVNCSLEIQRQLVQEHEKQDIEDPLLHRIGIHLGDVFFKNSDVMGNGVNIAARLQTEAYPGGICISQIVYDVVKSRLELNVTYVGSLQLRNIKHPQPAYHLHPHGDEAPVRIEHRQARAVSQPSSAHDIHEELTEEDPDVSPEPGPAPRDCLEPGSKVGGRYKVRRVLGQGGFGRSYLVEDTQRFGEFCVLKEFFPASTSKRTLQKALQLFKREAKTLYQIDHPQIPKFMACFTQGKRLFIVQEYINGVTYAQLMKQRKRENNCFSTDEVIQWLIHLLQVLDYLHNLSVVHRDISPDNIMYSSDRNLPVLIDFGLVNDTMNDILSGNLEEEDRERAKSATIVGKFGYSPPEQIRLGQCSPASDLYALGVTAIVLVTGKYPRELMDRGSLEWNWQRHVDLPHRLVMLLNKMTRQRPDERFQSAREVLEIAVTLTDSAHSPLPQAPTKPIDLSVDQTLPPLYEEPLQRGQSFTQDPAFLNQCREELTRSIGPMASVLVDDMLEQYPHVTPQELVALLAAQLSDGKQADDFTSRIYDKSVILDEPHTLRPNTTIQQSATAPQSGGRVSPEFLDRCRQALTQSIGPMADFLIEETLEGYPNLGPQDLVFQLATEIPDAKKAREFQQRLL